VVLMTDNITSRTSGGSNSAHGLLAYLVLMLVLLLSYALVFKPVAGVLKVHAQLTADLRDSLSQDQLNKNKLADDVEVLKQSVEQLTIKGLASSSSDISLLSHALHETVKRVLNRNGATIVLLSPSNVIKVNSLSQLRLDINFRISSNDVDGLLTSLANIRPEVAIKLFSLRRTSLASKNQSGVQLEASLLLSMAYFAEPLRLKLNSLEIDFPAVGSEPVTESSVNQNDNKIQTPHLAGFFSPSLRNRMRDPSPEHYRLTAITLSKGVRAALVADRLNHATRRLSVGDHLDGWRVERIEALGITFIRGQETKTLELTKQ
jgi:hypothetical protein